VHPLLLLTGFGSFEDVDRNPSGLLAKAFGERAPEGLDVFGIELPVTFHGSALELDRALAGLAPRVPHAILALGVHPGSGFRLERRARAVLGTGRPDVAGVHGAEVDLGGGHDLATSLDLEPLAAALRRAGAGSVVLSEDAGGYVCERIYRHVLERGRQLGVPALFLHVPPLASSPFERQHAVLRELLLEVGRVVSATSATPTTPRTR